MSEDRGVDTNSYTLPHCTAHYTVTSRYVERRGHGPHGPIIPPQVPRYCTRASAFDENALEAFARIDATFHDELSDLDLAVDIIPRMSLKDEFTLWPESVAADGPVPLGRLLPASFDEWGSPIRPRIVLFRKPIEERCEDEVEMQSLLHAILSKLVAYYLNVEPQIIDANYDKGPQV